MSRERYQQLDPISHIHQRPDMYVGSVRSTNHPWTYVLERDPLRIEKKENVVYPDGLLRLFIEVLSNAIDNVWRSRQENIRCTKIVVNVDKETGRVSIWNDGAHIPIEKTTTTDRMIPEMIFGHLLSGSNFDDTEEKFTSGRNGYGVKLANVFSTHFRILLHDPKQECSYEQVWTDHMRKVNPAKIRKYKKKTGSTLVEYVPDTSLFPGYSLDHHHSELEKIYEKLCVDASMTTRIPIHYNERKYHRNPEEYTELYSEVTKEKTSFEIGETRVVIAMTESSGGGGTEIGFVNGIYTPEGGIHCDGIMNDVLRKCSLLFKKQVNNKELRSYFFILVDAWLSNPEFNSQSKGKLLQSGTDISKWEIPTRHWNKMQKWSFVDKIREWILTQQQVLLKKMERKGRTFRKIEGYDPANLAGTKSSMHCTLILCEGLSAKTFGTTGINVGWNGYKGRDHFGILPLRGKVLNVQHATAEQVRQNKEVNNIIMALHLKFGVDYSDDNVFKTLSYGRVMIMTDADEDGYHISGLVINLFHHMFPTLFQRTTPFLYFMMTPIARIFESPTKVRTFYNDLEYEQALDHYAKRPKIKYYKGLGTSNDHEIRDVFGKKVLGLEKDAQSEDRIRLLFHKQASNERKEWLTGYDRNAYRTPETSVYTITSFLDQEVIKFSIADCRRNLANLYDGWKTSQRKILYSMFQKGETAVLKVAQLAGFCAEKTNYHHGEQCLLDTIIKMAQDFPGSNNVPCLERDGQFGSRVYGGKDAASARYVFTRLAKVTRLLFRPEDDAILEYVYDDGDRVEPAFYVPVLPLLLINGTSGIGTGWSCSLPNFSPREILERVQRYLETGETDLSDLCPSYERFTGSIEKIDESRYSSYGVLVKMPKELWYEITELPIGVWTNDYKEFLEDWLEQKKNITELKNYSTPEKVCFQIRVSKDFEPTLENMKLTKTLSMTNMVLFTENHRLVKFHSITEIFQEYIRERLVYYEKRKEHLISIRKKELEEWKTKQRFLELVVSERLRLFRVPKSVLVPVMMNTHHFSKEEVDMLLRIPCIEFTEEHIEELRKTIQQKEKVLNELKQRTVKEMWKEDLGELAKVLL